jgi:hypothetical protein
VPKQYDRALLEVEAKRQLEQARDLLNLPSLSATVNYLIDNLLADKLKPRTGVTTGGVKGRDTHN